MSFLGGSPVWVALLDAMSPGRSPTLVTKICYWQRCLPANAATVRERILIDMDSR